MLEKEIQKLLKSVGIEAEENQIETPPSIDMGDASFPCFPLAKEMKKSPVEIAKELSEKIKLPKNSTISKIESKGGYVNFFFDYPKFSKIVLKGLGKVIDVGKGKRVMVEYSQPNPVHPMHMGHARNTFLGDSIANIFNLSGYRIIRANYMNNVGLQVAKLVLAYNMWGEGKEPDIKSDIWLWKYYIKFHEEAKKDSRLDEEAKSILKSYEAGDKDTEKIWNKIVGWCIEGFEDTYKKIGIKFDIYFYEKDFRKSGKKIVEEALKKGVAKEIEDGAVLTNLEKHGLSDTILQRSNGTGLYITSDLGLTVHKFSKYNLDKSIWVTSSDQELNFRQLFKIFELLGYKFYKKCHHFSYERLDMAEGKMSSREGRAVMIDDVLKKITNLAYIEVMRRNPDMNDKERRKIAKKIGVGALKYNIVRIEPNKKIIFNWDQMLSLEGNTGPYLQYAHTRSCSILRRAGKFTENSSYPEMNLQERVLVKKLSEFRKVVLSSAREISPHIVCNYGYDLATAFNSFYQHSRVLNLEDEKQKNFRLSLVRSAKDILEKVFGLIGMEAPERM